MQLENYSEFLPICDDYEILLRTALNTKIIKIQNKHYSAPLLNFDYCLEQLTKKIGVK